ncbi:MAG: hypothetical protein H6Q56_234 [Deltaproteobacteria bacterium]|jgi:hypothetical protein|nr:hypothetical protein [Deltaproteobacteria bacterium]
MTAGNGMTCALCGESIDRAGEETVFADAGRWLAENHWQDSGMLCRLCLENRGRLAMMYLNEAEL